MVHFWAWLWSMSRRKHIAFKFKHSFVILTDIVFEHNGMNSIILHLQFLATTVAISWTFCVGSAQKWYMVRPVMWMFMAPLNI